MPANLENSAVATGLEKLFSFQSQRKAMPKNTQTTAQLHSSYMLVMFKYLQTRVQQYMKANFKMFKLDLKKAGEPEIKLPTFTGSWRKQESSRKTSASSTTVKPLTMWMTTNCGKFFNKWEYQIILPVS